MGDIIINIEELEKILREIKIDEKEIIEIMERMIEESKKALENHLQEWKRKLENKK